MESPQPYYQTTIRMPSGLYANIKAVAEANRRSVNSEILMRLEATEKEAQKNEGKH